jgi:dihydrodipicolinate synthase/N-acetylneuraminate lyase
MVVALQEELYRHLQEGTVIPAHPLALMERKELDTESQKRLTRYYISAGAGGVAVGVHTTQFEIRDPKYNLLEKVLALAAEAIEEVGLKRPFLKIAGICGETKQAAKEAEIARNLGYHLGLVSLGGLNHYSEQDLVRHVKEISQIIPVFGFYLQPAVGGRILSYEFWREVAEIKNLYAIKIAPFNRYQTLDVVRAVCESARSGEIALYTGNDDHILLDLLATYRFNINGKTVEKQIVGGLLGQWAVWTSKAVELFEEIKKVRTKDSIPAEYLKLANELTDANGAIFDAKNRFSGCISGIHEILRRQGLLKTIVCLSEKEKLSDGQLEEIDRIYQSYPHLNDDEFARKFLAFQNN